MMLVIDLEATCDEGDGLPAIDMGSLSNQGF